MSSFRRDLSASSFSSRSDFQIVQQRHDRAGAGPRAMPPTAMLRTRLVPRASCAAATSGELTVPVSLPAAPLATVSIRLVGMVSELHVLDFLVSDEHDPGAFVGLLFQHGDRQRRRLRVCGCFQQAVVLGQVRRFR